MRKTILVVFCFLLAGCAGLRERATINSIASPHAASYRTFVVLPGDSNVSVNDLEFQSYAAQVQQILESKGFSRSATNSPPDTAVLLFYRMGDPVTTTEHVSIPIFGQTGVSGAQTYGNVNTYGNTATYSATTTYAPTYGITGVMPSSVTRTRYFPQLIVAAYDARRVMENKSSDLVKVWETTVRAVTEMGDRRTAVNRMIQAGAPYIGTDMQRAVEIRLP